MAEITSPMSNSGDSMEQNRFWACVKLFLFSLALCGGTILLGVGENIFLLLLFIAGCSLVFISLLVGFVTWYDWEHIPGDTWATIAGNPMALAILLGSIVISAALCTGSIARWFAPPDTEGNNSRAEHYYQPDTTSLSAP